jgi:hypothetical protein
LERGERVRKPRYCSIGFTESKVKIDDGVFKKCREASTRRHRSAQVE